MDFIDASNPVRLSRGARPLTGIRSEEDLIMSLALTMGLDQVTSGHRRLAFDIAMQDVDPVRLASIATVLRSPDVRALIEREVPRFSSDLQQVHQFALEKFSEDVDTEDRQARLAFCRKLCRRDVAHLPQGWSIAHLWESGEDFCATFESLQERLCVAVMARFAIRKAWVTTMIGLSAGIGLAVFARLFATA